MSVKVIIGGAGDGKSSLMAAMVGCLIRTEGPQRLTKSIAKIEEFNVGREKPLTLPDQIPAYTNFDVKYNIGYQKVYKPYYIDAEYFGMPNMDKLVIPVVPYSIVGLDEMDEEYNSRKVHLSRSVAEMYNKRRHIGLEIIMALHRSMILDTIIRSVTDVFIYIQRLEVEKNFAGMVSKTTWYCREFDDPNEMERYEKTNGAEGVYRETVYVKEGNIFDCYDTNGCAQEFIPKDGEDFIYLKQRSEVDVKTLPPELAKFYSKGAKKNERGKQTGAA